MTAEKTAVKNLTPRQAKLPRHANVPQGQCFAAKSGQRENRMGKEITYI